MTVVSVKEAAIWDKTGVRATHKFRVTRPTCATIDETYRLKSGNDVYNIRGVEDATNKGIFITLILEKVR
jgi:head-tail adaptor